MTTRFFWVPDFVHAPRVQTAWTPPRVPSKQFGRTWGLLCDPSASTDRLGAPVPRRGVRKAAGLQRRMHTDGPCLLAQSPSTLEPALLFSLAQRGATAKTR